LDLDAEYDTRPFDPPLCYAVRATHGRGDRSWALDFVHHKLYLANPPAEVQRFSISHGFNLLTLQRLWPAWGATACAGAGVVIAHPESRVREKPLPEDGGAGGYYLAGPAVALGIGKKLNLTRRFFVSVEGRVTLAYVSVPVADGEAELTNVAFHAFAGPGIRL
jgi:hypothetical protein